MAIREIRIYGDPILREKAAPVVEIDDEIRALAADMLETLSDADGIGLAAPQVGISLRLVVVHPPAPAGESRERARVYLNPEILEKTGPLVEGEEGCLSIPGIYEMVRRPERVRFRARDLEGRELEAEAEGTLARILQHEVDHLEGILFVDRIGPMRRALLRKKLREFLE